MKIRTEGLTLEVINTELNKVIKTFDIQHMVHLEDAFQVLSVKGVGLMDSEKEALRNHFRPLVTQQIHH